MEEWPEIKTETQRWVVDLSNYLALQKWWHIYIMKPYVRLRNPPFFFGGEVREGPKRVDIRQGEEGVVVVL